MAQYDVSLLTSVLHILASVLMNILNILTQKQQTTYFYCVHSVSFSIERQPDRIVQAGDRWKHRCVVIHVNCD